MNRRQKKKWNKNGPGFASALAHVARHAEKMGATFGELRRTAARAYSVILKLPPEIHPVTITLSLEEEAA